MNGAISIFTHEFTYESDQTCYESEQNSYERAQLTAHAPFDAQAAMVSYCYETLAQNL